MWMKETCHCHSLSTDSDEGHKTSAPKKGTSFVRILVSVINVKLREVKHDVCGKRQDEISFLPKHGETKFN